MTWYRSLTEGLVEILMRSSLRGPCVRNLQMPCLKVVGVQHQLPWLPRQPTFFTRIAERPVKVRIEFKAPDEPQTPRLQSA
jgi:hypothetical protein